MFDLPSRLSKSSLGFNGDVWVAGAAVGLAKGLDEEGGGWLGDAPVSLAFCS